MEQLPFGSSRSRAKVRPRDDGGVRKRRSGKQPRSRKQREREEEFGLLESCRAQMTAFEQAKELSFKSTSKGEQESEVILSARFSFVGEEHAIRTDKTESIEERFNEATLMDLLRVDEGTRKAYFRQACKQFPTYLKSVSTWMSPVRLWMMKWSGLSSPALFALNRVCWLAMASSFVFQIFSSRSQHSAGTWILLLAHILIPGLQFHFLATATHEYIAVGDEQWKTTGMDLSDSENHFKRLAFMLQAKAIRGAVGEAKHEGWTNEGEVVEEGERGEEGGSGSGSGQDEGQLARGEGGDDGVDGGDAGVPAESKRKDLRRFVVAEECEAWKEVVKGTAFVDIATMSVAFLYFLSTVQGLATTLWSRCAALTEWYSQGRPIPGAAFLEPIALTLSIFFCAQFSLVAAIVVWNLLYSTIAVRTAFGILFSIVTKCKLDTVAESQQIAKVFPALLHLVREVSSIVTTKLIVPTLVNVFLNFGTMFLYVVSSLSGESCTPIWTVVQLFFSAFLFMCYVTALGMNNIYAKRLSEALRERQIDFEISQCTRVRGSVHEDLVHIADILSNLSKLDVGCAEIFGISITERMINTIWGETAVSILLTGQAIAAASHIFTPHFLSCSADVDAEAWVPLRFNVSQK